MQVPIGISNFRQITTSNLHYVDKSLLIKEIIDNECEAVIVITRPRRFGKTLNLSMLHHFFAAEVAGQPTNGLFDELKISQEPGEYIEKEQGKYPVISLTLKDLKESTFETAKKKIASLLSDVFLDFEYLLESTKLSGILKNKIQAILNETAEFHHIEESLKVLTRSLYEHHGVQPIVLIDEYDTPLHEAYLNDYLTEMTDFMRGFLGGGLKDNKYLKKSVVTGILRIARESLFSDFNNTTVYSLFDSKYCEHFGFLENEVEDLIRKAELSTTLEIIKSWYNGYEFGKCLVYNPWSIVNCIANAGELKPYWVNTSQNKLIKSLITQAGARAKRDLNTLLQGKPVVEAIHENLSFTDIETTETGFWTLLLMSGYLKVVDSWTKKGILMCQLEVPNREVLELYQIIIIEWLSQDKSARWYQNFVEE